MLLCLFPALSSVHIPTIRLANGFEYKRAIKDLNISDTSLFLLIAYENKLSPWLFPSIDVFLINMIKSTKKARNAYLLSCRVLLLSAATNALKQYMINDHSGPFHKRNGMFCTVD